MRRSRSHRLGVLAFSGAMIASACSGGSSVPDAEGSTTTEGPSVTNVSTTTTGISQGGGGLESILDVPTIELLTPEASGERPILEWTTVQGADGYRLVVLDAEGAPYWAWQGQTTSAVFGGGEDEGDGGQLAIVHESMTWSVVAIDGSRSIVGRSAVGVLVP